MARIAFIIATASLAACASPEEIQRAYVDAAVSSCDGYGFQRGTQPHALCVEREVQSSRASAQAASLALASHGQQLSTPAPVSSTRCTTRQVGQSLVTDCF